MGGLVCRHARERPPAISRSRVCEGWALGEGLKRVCETGRREGKGGGGERSKRVGLWTSVGTAAAAHAAIMTR